MFLLGAEWIKVETDETDCSNYRGRRIYRRRISWAAFDVSSREATAFLSDFLSSGFASPSAGGTAVMSNTVLPSGTFGSVPGASSPIPSSIAAAVSCSSAVCTGLGVAGWGVGSSGVMSTGLGATGFCTADERGFVPAAAFNPAAAPDPTDLQRVRCRRRVGWFRDLDLDREIEWS